MDRLRYSDRKKVAEQGSLGPLEYGTVPATLRRAVASIHHHAARHHTAGNMYDTNVSAACEQHFGRTFHSRLSTGPTVEKLIDQQTLPIDDFLDVCEIVAEKALEVWTFESGAWQADPQVERHLNAAFARHRFGYRISEGQIRRIGSPAMDEAVVGPALIATARPGWEEADRSYRDALNHRRGGTEERGAAITDAHAALEAAMKAAGLKGDTLATLAKSFRNSGLVLPQLEGVPEMLDKLLKRSQAVRDSLSDAHGRDPGTDEVPAEVVDLAIHWTGAFIVYLAEATA